ncbi:hypothetical protein BaRGS_00006500 [Batillaria attramentaria]|uniref:Uncharacterized protein n=1 Tax=Batillaria attramentaria TaxID=370345 RepID=A0ABD0LRM4_9CAEN
MRDQLMVDAPGRLWTCADTPTHAHPAQHPGSMCGTLVLNAGSTDACHVLTPHPFIPIRYKNTTPASRSCGVCFELPVFALTYYPRHACACGFDAAIRL